MRNDLFGSRFQGTVHDGEEVIFFIHSEPPAHEMVLLILGVGLLWKHSHRHIQRWASIALGLNGAQPFTMVT